MVLLEKLKSFYLIFTEFVIVAIVTLFDCNSTKIYFEGRMKVTKIPMSFHNKFLYKYFLLPLLRRITLQEIIRIEMPTIKYPLRMRSGTSDIDVFEQIFVDEEYDLKLSNEPNFIIDGGANIGFASILFANKFPKAEIIAVEPDLSNFEILKKNVRYYKNIKSIRSAIWSKTCYLKAEDIGAGKWMIVVKETDKDDPSSFKSVTIDTLLECRKRRSINLLKLDIEGSEKEIFSLYYQDWLKKIDILIIELHDRLVQGCTEAFNRAIEPLGYKKISKGENIVLFKT